MKTPDFSIIQQRLVEHMNEAVWMGDRHEKTIYANPKFCKLLGYTLEEMMGRPSYDFWDKESADRVRSVNKKERRKGVSSSYEGNLLTRNKKKIPVLVSGTPLPDGGTIGIMTDLTELKNRESIYRRLIEHMNEAVWMGDRHEKTIYANPKFCKLLGYTLEEMMGRPSYDFWDKESADRVRSVNKKERHKGLSSSYEGNLLTKGKKRIPVLLSGTPLPDGGTIGIMTDLTELKKKEETERVLGHAVQSANDAMVILDASGLIRSWNKGARMMFGFKKEDVLGKSLRKILHIEGIDSTLTRASVRYNHQFDAKHKNKHVVRLSATITPVPSDTQGKGSDMWLLIARDVTAQSKFEEELALKYQKLRDAYNKFGITRRQMDYIFDLVHIATSSQTRRQLADFVVNAVIMLTRVDACVLRVHNTEKKFLELLSSFGLTDDWRGKSSIKLRGSLGEKAFTLRAPLKVIDLTQEPRYHSPHLAKKHHLLSMLIIPLIVDDGLVGTLSLYVSPEKKLELFENEFIEQYASIVALALARIAA